MRISTLALPLLLTGCLPSAVTSIPTAPDAGSTSIAQGPAPLTIGAPYPIVLCHGMFGFDHIGPLDYFYGIPDLLRSTGRKVYTPRVDALNSSDDRGAELMKQVEAAKQDSGADKVILIGHSQGGLDARWVAHNDPSAVAAVITISSPHHGSMVADVALGLTPFGVTEAAFDAMENFVGGTVDGSTSDTEAVLKLFTTKGQAAFNAVVTDAPGIPYYSIAGRSALAPARLCDDSNQPPFMAKWNNDLDPVAPELVAVAGILETASLPELPVQDALVTVPSATWGTFLGCIPADHLDEVCQLAGDGPGIGNHFDCLDFYLGLEQYLTDHSL